MYGATHSNAPHTKRGISSSFYAYHQIPGDNESRLGHLGTGNYVDSSAVNAFARRYTTSDWIWAKNPVCLLPSRTHLLNAVEGLDMSRKYFDCDVDRSEENDGESLQTIGTSGDRHAKLLMSRRCGSSVGTRAEHLQLKTTDRYTQKQRKTYDSADGQFPVDQKVPSVGPSCVVGNDGIMPVADGLNLSNDHLSSDRNIDGTLQPMFKRMQSSECNEKAARQRLMQAPAAARHRVLQSLSSGRFTDKIARSGTSTVSGSPFGSPKMSGALLESNPTHSNGRPSFSIVK